MLERHGIPLVGTVTRWYCPACRATDVTTRAGFHQQFHTCPKNGFLAVPFVREGVKAKVETTLREDYVGQELVQLDANGKPVMNVTITRDEGMDVAVYAPTATATIEEVEGT